MIDPRTRRPEEGWLSLVLVGLMIAVVASAVDDPAWVNGRGYLTDGLVWLGLLGVAVGFIGPQVGWGRWTTHAVGAVFAGAAHPDRGGLGRYPGLSIGQTFGHTAYGTIPAYLDIAWRGLRVHRPGVHFVVVLGIIMWGDRPVRLATRCSGTAGRSTRWSSPGCCSSRTCRRRSATELPYLVVVLRARRCSCSSGCHAFDERATWIRRRIGDPGNLVPLPARRDRVHPRGDARLVAADTARPRAAGRRLGPRSTTSSSSRGDAPAVPARGRRARAWA